MTLGVEEEFFIVDARTGELRNEATAIIPDMPGAKHELFECLVELTTPVSKDIGEIESALESGRRRLVLACEPHGLRPFASGTYPLPVGVGIEVADTPYFRSVAGRLGDALSSQLVCGLHVHVGLASLAATQNALEGVIPWLPALLSAAANSPFGEGVETPYRSLRAKRLAEIEPSQLPPAGGGVPDAKESGWWDIRINRHHGTLEIRVADQPTDVRRSLAIVAVVHILVVIAAGRQNPVANRDEYLRERERAVRGSLPTLELAKHLEPVAAGLGYWDQIAAFLGSEREADRQLRIEQAGGLKAVAADIVERT